MEFREGATVQTATGEKLGTIGRIVIDPISQQVTYIVVEKGFLFKEDRVIPIEMLVDGDGDHVQLVASVDDLDDFPHYEHQYYVEPGYSDQPYLDWSMEPLLYYPPLGAEQAHQNMAQVHSTIPENSIVISEGTKVYTIDEEHAGNVEQIFTSDRGQVTHLLLSSGFLFPKERLIPLGWVRQLTDNEVKLYVRNEVIEDLPDYKATTG